MGFISEPALRRIIPFSEKILTSCIHIFFFLNIYIIRNTLLSNESEKVYSTQISSTKYFNNHISYNLKTGKLTALNIFSTKYFSRIESKTDFLVRFGRLVWLITACLINFIKEQMSYIRYCFENLSNNNMINQSKNILKNICFYLT